MEKRKIKGMRIGLVSFVVIASMLSYIYLNPAWVKDEETGFSQVKFLGSMVSATENTTIGSTASGFLEIFFVNHTATPATAYDDNTSSVYETWCNASLDPDGSGSTYKAYANYGAFSLTLKWGTTFDIVVRYRGNATNAKNATIYNVANCRVKINASGGGVTLTEVTGTNIATDNSSAKNFIWINSYFNNGGAGYTLDKGGTCTITNIKIEFNY